MPPSSADKRRALAGSVLQFSEDLTDLAIRISWALPTSSRYMNEQELASITASAATIAQVRDDLAELASWLAVEVVPPEPS
jgi:hypothetical protein